MARGRVNRRYGPGPYVAGLRRDADRWRQGFPFDLPALEAPERYLRAIEAADDGCE